VYYKTRESSSSREEVSEPKQLEEVLLPAKSQSPCCDTCREGLIPKLGYPPLFGCSCFRAALFTQTGFRGVW